MDVFNAIAGWINRVMRWVDVSVDEGQKYSGWIFMGLFLLMLSKAFKLSIKI